MGGRFVLAVLGAALVGGLIGFADEQDPMEAGIFAAIGVALVVWAQVRVFREKLAEGDRALGATLRSYARWGLIVVGVFIAAIAGLLALESSRDEAGFLWRDSQVEPEPVRALKGVRLGEKLADVSARLGAFDLEKPVSGPGDAARVDNYLQRGGRTRLRVEGDRVTRVSYECHEGDGTRVNRVECHARESRVVHVFGNGARRLCANAAKAGSQAAVAAGAYAFDVIDTGTRYITLEGQVRGFIIMEPRDLEEALGGDQLWRRCS